MNLQKFSTTPFLYLKRERDVTSVISIEKEMTSTELKVGLSVNGRTSSRVLKPPGGGHSNIFAEPEVSVNAPRPKYNQQNSTNLNACLGSTDANAAVEKLRDEIAQTTTASIKSQVKVNDNDNGSETIAKETNQKFVEVSENATAATINSGGNGENSNTIVKGRVPPGGYSSGGFW